MQPGAQIPGSPTRDNSPPAKGGDQKATAKNPLANLLNQIQSTSSPDKGNMQDSCNVY